MKLDKIFASHMVLQAGKPIKIYGSGNGTVSLSFAGFNKSEAFSGDTWLIELPAMEYGGPFEMTVCLDGKTVTLDDIYIGDVYLFSGQSNMQFKIHESNTAAESCNANEKLRLFSTERLEKSDRFTPEDGWVVCEKDNIEHWSAIGYLVGNELALKKDVAVGVIACYQGASVIESWVPKGAFEKIGINLPDESKSIDHFHEPYDEWRGDGVLYSFALSQVTPYPLAGVIWYQGESDSSLDESLVYADELCEMIRIWRQDFCDDSLPFIIVQIANYIYGPLEGWANIQKAQIEVSKRLENVKTVICADICEDDDIHPKTKDKLSHRIVEALL